MFMRGFNQTKNGNNKVPRDGIVLWTETEDYWTDVYARQNKTILALAEAWYSE